MRWPWSRAETPAQEEVSGYAAVTPDPLAREAGSLSLSAPVQRRDWASMPPMPRTIGPAGWVRPDLFARSLPSHTPPAPMLQRLGHEVRPLAPAGSAVGLARVTGAPVRADLPPLPRSAVQRSRAGTTSTGPAPRAATTGMAMSRTPNASAPAVPSAPPVSAARELPAASAGVDPVGVDPVGAEPVGVDPVDAELVGAEQSLPSPSAEGTTAVAERDVLGLPPVITGPDLIAPLPATAASFTPLPAVAPTVSRQPSGRTAHAAAPSNATTIGTNTAGLARTAAMGAVASVPTESRATAADVGARPSDQVSVAAPSASATPGSASPRVLQPQRRLPATSTPPLLPAAAAVFPPVRGLPILPTPPAPQNSLSAAGFTESIAFSGALAALPVVQRSSAATASDHAPSAPPALTAPTPAPAPSPPAQGRPPLAGPRLGTLGALESPTSAAPTGAIASSAEAASGAGAALEAAQGATLTGSTALPVSRRRIGAPVDAVPAAVARRVRSADTGSAPMAAVSPPARSAAAVRALPVLRHVDAEQLSPTLPDTPQSPTPQRIAGSGSPGATAPLVGSLSLLPPAPAAGPSLISVARMPATPAAYASAPARVVAGGPATAEPSGTVAAPESSSAPLRLPGVSADVSDGGLLGGIGLQDVLQGGGDVWVGSAVASPTASRPSLPARVQRATATAAGSGSVAPPFAGPGSAGGSGAVSRLPVAGSAGSAAPGVLRTQPGSPAAPVQTVTMTAPPQPSLAVQTVPVDGGPSAVVQAEMSVDAVTLGGASATGGAAGAGPDLDDLADRLWVRVRPLLARDLLAERERSSLLLDL